MRTLILFSGSTTGAQLTKLRSVYRTKRLSEIISKIVVIDQDNLPALNSVKLPGVDVIKYSDFITKKDSHYLICVDDADRKTLANFVRYLCSDSSLSWIVYSNVNEIIQRGIL